MYSVNFWRGGTVLAPNAWPFFIERQFQKRGFVLLINGRPPSLDCKQLQLVREMYADLKKSPKEICQVFNISRSALYRYVAQDNLIMQAEQGSNQIAHG